MLKGLTSTFRNNCNNIELTYKEYIVIEGQTIPIRAKITDDCYENGNFIGSFILKTIQFETNNDIKFRNKEFEYYKVVDGESIKIGTFITTEITDNDTTELVRVTGMDYGLKTQVEYKSSLDYSSGNVTLMDVWNECCELSGIESGVDEFENSDFIVDSDQFTGTGATIRDVFKGIALSSGSFIKVMNDDKIYPIFKTHTETLLEDSINNSKTIENVLEIDKINELKGNTQQDSYTGKNLYNTTMNETKAGITITGTTEKVVINGTATSSDNKIDIGVAVLPAGTYTITNEFLSGSGQMTGWVYQKGTWNRPVTTDLGVGTGYSNRSYATFTLTQTTQICFGLYYVKDRVYNNATIRLQIVKGSTPDYDYEPYVGGTASPNPDYPQEIETVTGLQNINVKSENLKNNNNIFNGYLDASSITSNANNKITYIPVENNKKYIIEKILSARFRIGFTDTIPANGVTIYNFDRNDNVTSMQLTNTTHKYLCVWYWTNQDTLTEQEILNSINIYTESNTYEVNLVKDNVFNFNNYVSKSANVEIVSQTENTLVANVTQASTWQTIRYDINNLKKNTDYSIKFNFENTYESDLYKHTWLSIRGGSTNLYNDAYYKDDVITFSTGDNTTIGFIFHVTINAPAVINTITISNVKLQEVIELCKIGNYQDSIKKSTGKNLFNKSTIIEGQYIDGSGVIQNDPDNFLGDFISIDNTKSYYVSSNTTSAKRIVYYNENKEYISREVLGVRGSILTIPNNAKYVRLSCYNDNLTTLQLELGTQQTSYEPYGKVWYIEKQIGKVVLDGSESGYSYTNNTNATDYGYITSTLIDNLSQTNNGLTNNFKNYGTYFLYNTNTNGEVFCITSSGTQRLRFMVLKSRLSTLDVAGFKTWLSTHNTEVVYALATPTYEVITNEELINQLESIRLLKGLNNISITSNNLTPTIDLSYWNDDSEVIEDYTELEDKRDTHPWTCVRLGMSQIDGENVDMIDEDLVEQYGENWLILNDNPFAYSQEKREQLITAIFNKVKGFGYSAFVSKTSFKPYMTCGDTLKFKNRNGDLVDSILLRYSHEYKENDMQIQLEAPSETSATVNYVYPLSAIDINKRTQIEVDKDKVQITNLTAQTSNIQDNLSRNYLTKEDTNILVQNARTGLTNTFSEAGGNNIFRNTGLFFENNGSDRNENPYEFWNGLVARTKEDKASNQNALLLQEGSVYQEQIVPNGKYTISFKYKKIIALSNLKVYINDEEIVLNKVEDTEYMKSIEVTSQHITVRFVTDVDNGCEIYDLMVNAGSVKLAYSQNQNETTTDTVNISKGIEVTSSETNTRFRADSDGIRILNKNSDEEKTKFTDKGMETNEATINDRATIVKTLFQEVGNHTWITRL